MIRYIIRNTTAREWAGDFAGLFSLLAIIAMVMFLAPLLCR